MIFTFRLHNSYKKYLLYAEDKEEAFSEIRARLGKDADNWSLIAYCESKRFSMYLD